MVFLMSLNLSLVFSRGQVQALYFGQGYPSSDAVFSSYVTAEGTRAICPATRDHLVGVVSACFLHWNTAIFPFVIIHLRGRYFETMSIPCYSCTVSLILFFLLSSRMVLGMSLAAMVLQNTCCGLVHLLCDSRVVRVHVLQHNPCLVPLRSLHSVGRKNVQLYLY